MEYNYLRTMSDAVMLVGPSMISLGHYASTKFLILLNVSLASLPIDMISLPTRMYNLSVFFPVYLAVQLHCVYCFGYSRTKTFSPV